MDTQEYIQQFIHYPHPVLKEIDRDSQQRNDIEPNIGLQAACLIDILLRSIQAKNVLELGTCIGFSTITLANVMHSIGGHLTAIEFNPARVHETCTNLEKAGLLEVVTLIQADASLALAELTGPFDLILQDSDKFLYPKLFERCFELLRPGGILVADDTLFPTMPIPERYKPPINEYNQKVFDHPGLVSTILPIGDGLTISFKNP